MKLLTILTEQHSITVFRQLWGEGNGNPLQFSCLENPVDRGAWQTAEELDTSERLSTATQWLGKKTMHRVNQRLQEPSSIKTTCGFHTHKT